MPLNTSRKPSVTQGIFLGLSLMLYVVACVLPSLETKAEVLTGLQCLALGPFSVLGDLGQFFIWCANLFFFLSLSLQWLRFLPRLSLFASLLSILLASAMLLKASITYDVQMVVLHFHWGYYAWLGAQVVAGIGSLVGFFVRPPQSSRQGV